MASIVCLILIKILEDALLQFEVSTLDYVEWQSNQEAFKNLIQIEYFEKEKLQSGEIARKTAMWLKEMDRGSTKWEKCDGEIAHSNWTIDILFHRLF